MKYIRLILNIGLALLISTFVSCEMAELPEQEVSDTISPDGYPVATFTTDFSGSTVTEGDTIKYTITTDKPIERDLQFVVMMKGGDADSHDYIAETALLPAYKTSTQMEIIFLKDDVPELEESISIEIGVEDLGQKYLLNPSTVNPTLDLNITNVNAASMLTVAVDWTTMDDDVDIFAMLDGTGLAAYAASSDNPEIMMIGDDFPDGTYWIGFDPYYIEGNSFDYKVRFGASDQSVSIIEGTFDMSALANYEVDDLGGTTLYRVAKVVKSGTSYTYTDLME